MEQGALALGRKQSPRSRRRSEGGFTLVEILVVITIIGLIMALVGPRVLNYLSESKVKTARIQIQKSRQRARSFLSRRRPLSVERRRPRRAGAANRRRCVLEWPLSQRWKRAAGSLGKSICVPIAGRTWRLRCCLSRLRWTGRRKWNSGRYCELVAVTAVARRMVLRCSRSSAFLPSLRCWRPSFCREFPSARRGRGWKPMRSRPPHCCQQIGTRQCAGTRRFRPMSTHRRVRCARRRPVVSCAFRPTWFSTRSYRGSATIVRRFRPLASCRRECRAADRSCSRAWGRVTKFALTG